MATQLKREWVKQLSAWNTAGSDEAPSIIADTADGSIYLAYETTGTMSGGYNEGNTAIAICKISREGQVIWTNQSRFNTSNYESTPKLAFMRYQEGLVLSVSRLFVVYTTTGTVSGGDQNMSSSQDIVVMSLIAETGQIEWLKQWSEMNTSLTDFQPAICANSNGIYVAYATLGVISGGVDAGNGDIVIVQLDDETGDIQARLQDKYNTNQADSSPVLAIDGSYVYLAYTTEGAVSGQISAGGTTDIVVAKVNADDLNQVWLIQNTISTGGADTEVSIAAKNNNIYISYLTDSVVSGGIDTASLNLAIMCLSAPNGDITWTYQQEDINPSTATASGPQVAVSYNGVYCVYRTDKALSGCTYSGSTDVAFISLSSDGELLELRQEGTSEADSAPAIAVIDGYTSDGVGFKNEIYVAYTTVGTVSGGQPSGQNDIAIMRYTDTTIIPPESSFDNNFRSFIGVDDKGYVYTTHYHNPITGNMTAICKTTGDGFVVWRKEILPGAIIRKVHTTVQGDMFLLNGSGAGDDGFNITRVRSDGTVETWASGIISGYEIAVPELGIETALLQVSDMTFDPSGNCFVVTSINGVVSGGDSRGEQDIVLCKIDSSGEQEWLKQLANYNTTGHDGYASVITDNSGNIILSYMTDAAISGGVNIGDIDVVLFKLDNCGQILYSRQDSQVSGPDDDTGPLVCVDGSNNIFKLNYAPGNFSVQKFGDTLATRVYQTDISTQAGLEILGYDYAVDESGYGYLAYVTNSEVSGGQSYSGLADIVLTRIEPGGNVEWVCENSSFNTPGWEYVPRIAVKGDYIYMTLTTVSSAGRSDIVICKFAKSDGSIVWKAQNGQINFPAQYPSPNITSSTVIDTAENDVWLTVSADYDGNAYVAFASSGQISGGESSGDKDIILCKISTSGEKVWNHQSSQINTSGIDLPIDVACKYDDIYVLSYGADLYGVHRIDKSGNYVSKTTLGSAFGVLVYCIDNDRNIIYEMDPNLIKINLSGTELWSYQLSGTACSIKTDDENNCIVLQYMPQYVADYSLQVLKLDSSGNLLQTINVADNVLQPDFFLRSYQIATFRDSIYLDYLDSDSRLCIKKYQGEQSFSYVLDTLSPIKLCADNNGNIYILAQHMFTLQPTFAVYKLTENLQTVWCHEFASYHSYVNTEMSLASPNIAATDDCCILVRPEVGTHNDFSIVVERLSIDSNSLFLDWQKTILPEFDGACSLAVDVSGYAIVAYTSSQEASGGAASGSSDIILTKIDDAGVIQWNSQNSNFNTIAEESAPSIACDGQQNIYISYMTYGEVSGGQQSGSIDIVVAKFREDGTLNWTVQQPTFNTDTDDMSPAIAVNDGGDAYVAFLTYGTISGGELSGDLDIVVLKINTSGGFQWARQQGVFNTSLADGIPKVASTQAGVYVAYISFSNMATNLFFMSKEGEYQGPTVTISNSSTNYDIAVDQSGYCYMATLTMLEKYDSLLNRIYVVQWPYMIYDMRTFMSGQYLYISYDNNGSNAFFKIDPATGSILLRNDIYNPDWNYVSAAIDGDGNGNIYRAYTDADGRLRVNRYIEESHVFPPVTLDSVDNIADFFSGLFYYNPGAFTDDFQVAVKRLLCGLNFPATMIEAPEQFPTLFKTGRGYSLVKRIIVLFPDNPVLSTEQVQQMLDRETYLYIPANVGRRLTVQFGSIPVDIIFNRDSITVNDVLLGIPEGFPWSGDRAAETYTVDIGSGLNLWYNHIGSGLFGLFTTTSGPVPCFTGDARVLTTRGYVPMRELKKGQKIITGDGRRVPISLVKTWVLPASRDSYPYLLPSSTGRKYVAVSGDHRIYTGPKEKFQLTDGRWTPAEFTAVKDIRGLRRLVKRGNMTWYNLQLPDYYRDTMIVDGIIAESLRHIKYRRIPLRAWDGVRKNLSTAQVLAAVVKGDAVMVPYEEK